MTLLAIIGALALTGLLLWVTLGNLAVFLWSDYGVKDTIAWNWKYLWLWWVLNILVAVAWWFLVGTHITIGFV